MAEPLIEKALRRDRLITALAVFVITALAWLYIIHLARDMSAMAAMADMPGMNMVMPGVEAWDGARLALTFVMWSVMMLAMMLPSAAPVILLYARVARSAAVQGRVFASTFWFALGYLSAWVGFSLAATLTQYALTQAALITPTAALVAPWAGAALLIAAGIYQWTPLKDSCLSRCRAPLAFVQAHGGFKPGAAASVRLGLLHGLYCIGCCWLLMALLFVGGVMNLLWIAALAALVLAEKLLPGGRWIARISGLAFFAAAAALLQ